MKHKLAKKCHRVFIFLLSCISFSAVSWSCLFEDELIDPFYLPKLQRQKSKLGNFLVVEHSAM